MNKQLENAINFLKKMYKEYKTFGDLHNPEFEDTEKIYKQIETVLKELERLQEDYIPKDKIREGIAEHRNYLLNQAITSNPALDAHFRDKENYVIKILKELLEAR